MPSRRPLTGVITIDWVDAADPDDADPPSNFGWSMRPEPMLDDQRLILLLREIANTLEEGLTAEHDDHADRTPPPEP